MTKINSIKTSNGSVHKIDEGMAYPSSKYINLVLEEDGHIYTAPANGIVFVTKYTKYSNRYVDIKDMTTGLMSIQHSVGTNQYLTAWLPVSAGAQFRVRYTAEDVLESFRFVYAQGSEPDEE